MKFTRLISVALLIVFNLMNARVEEPKPYSPVYHSFEWVEKYKNSNEEKWRFLIGIYEKHKDALESLNLHIKPANLTKEVDDKSRAKWLKGIILKTGKHYDISCFIPGIWYGGLTTHKLIDYEKFLSDDIKRLGKNSKKLMSFKKNPGQPEPVVILQYSGLPEEIIKDDQYIYNEDDVEYNEFIQAAVGLLTALQEIKALIKLNPEYYYE